VLAACAFLASATFADLPSYATKEVPWDPPLLGAARFTLLKTKPLLIKSTPKAAEGTLLFARLRLGVETEIAAAVVAARDRACRLYVDTNADGKLADEKPLASSASLNGELEALFEPVELSVKYEAKGKSVRQRVRLGLVKPDRDGDRALACVVDRVRQAGVPLAKGRGRGEPRLVGLLDLSGEARWDDWVTDALWFDADGDRKLQPAEVQPLTTVLAARDDLWSLRPAPDGRHVAFGRYEGSRGTLRLETLDGRAQPADLVQFRVNDGQVYLTWSQPPPKLELPTSEYKLEYVVRPRGQTGDPVEYRFATLQPLALSADRATSLVLGGDIRLDTKLTPTTEADGTDVEIEMQLLTPEGHILQWMKRGQQFLRAGSLKLLRPDGSTFQATPTGFG
jgi:hypothetical protein